MTLARPVPSKGHCTCVQEEGNNLHKLNTENALASSEEQELSMFKNPLP
jgi:hypothetical protein